MRWFRKWNTCGGKPMSKSSRAAQNALDEACERLATAQDRAETVDKIKAQFTAALRRPVSRTEGNT